jgi:hypothetical protein
MSIINQPLKIANYDSFLNELLKFDEKILDSNNILELDKTDKKYAFWLPFKIGEEKIEGKFFFKENLRKRLIIYVPGFPGDGAPKFEKLHVNKLVENKFTVFTMRNNGIFLNKEYSSKFIGSYRRQKKASLDRQTILGNKSEYSFNDLLKQPYLLLKAVSDYFEEIYFISHSLGTLSVLYSLCDFAKEFPHHSSRVKKVISLAGKVGKLRDTKDNILTDWEQVLKNPKLKEIIKIKGLKKNLAILKNAHTKIHEKGQDLIPKLTNLIFINAFGDTQNRIDEYVSPIESLDLIASLGRGFLVIDKTQKSNPKTGREAHSMENLKTEIILNLINNDNFLTDQISVIS